MCKKCIRLAYVLVIPGGYLQENFIYVQNTLEIMICKRKIGYSA